MTLEQAQFFKQNTKSTNKMIIEITDSLKLKLFFIKWLHEKKEKAAQRIEVM